MQRRMIVLHTVSLLYRLDNQLPVKLADQHLLLILLRLALNVHLDWHFERHLARRILVFSSAWSA